jgi:hypothetical protein
LLIVVLLPVRPKYTQSKQNAMGNDISRRPEQRRQAAISSLDPNNLMYFQ